MKLLQNIINKMKSSKIAKENIKYPELAVLRNLINKVENGKATVEIDGSYYDWSSTIIVKFKTEIGIVQYEMSFNKGEQDHNMFIRYPAILEIAWDSQSYKMYNLLFKTYSEVGVKYKDYTEKNIKFEEEWDIRRAEERSEYLAKRVLEETKLKDLQSKIIAL